ncbi:MAG: CBS domain-containing protein, partial [Nanoarchaeota archaeon]
MIVEDLMKKPIAIEKDVMLVDAAKLMTKHKINSLIFLVNDKIAGIITHEDLVAHFGEQKKVSEIMTRQVLMVKKNDKIQKAMDLIREKNISIVPVVDNKGDLVGVVHA